MWQQAIEDAVAKTKKNLMNHGEQFPHITEGNRYQWGDNNDWIEGFYTGLVWLSYEFTGDEFFKNAAYRQIDNFRERLRMKTSLDHHDIGFLYMPSAFAGWLIDKNEEAKQLALEAADHLMTRWRPEGGYIQAWGAKGDPAIGGKIIIDCMMNLPLLYWAYEQTGDSKYRDAAVTHANKSRRFLMRGDDSSYHTFDFNMEDGTPVRGNTHQGYTDGSTWSRGQAWAVYGFALSYRYTRDPLYLDTALRAAKYFIQQLPEDAVAYWDFNVPVEEGTPRDSSASAIAVCGMLEIVQHIGEDHADRGTLLEAIQRTMVSLKQNYSTMGESEAEGLIKHGSYHVLAGKGPDDFMIWGDYFYLEALMRLERGIPGYWYER